MDLKNSIIHSEKEENLSNTVIEAPSTLVPVTTPSSNGHIEIDPKPQQA